MQRIKLWSVAVSGGKYEARPVGDVDHTETEKHLEDLVVASPELLEPDLNLVGRQVPCAGGYIDLLGIDSSGRLVVFELKRGTLTREAVAQVLDYASDLAAMDGASLSRLIEEGSGRHGVDKIEDFADWYAQEYPDADDPLEGGPRMVLVGLGVDARALRISSFLTEAGVQLRLLTFHGFREGDRLFLGRQEEVTAPERPRGTSAPMTKTGNLEVLHAKAEELGLTALLEQVKAFIEERLGGYCWPGKTTYSFSLQERTEEGRPTLRKYVTVYVVDGPPQHLLIEFAPRATDAAGPAVADFQREVPTAAPRDKSYSALEVKVDGASWGGIASALGPLLVAIGAGWKRATTGS